MKPDLFYAMGLMTRAGFYTHLGYWLSDQCDIQTKVGTFAGKEKMSAIGGIHTLTGCIVDQYMQILAYLNNHAPDSVIIAGLGLVDARWKGVSTGMTETKGMATLASVMYYYNLSKRTQLYTGASYSNGTDLLDGVDRFNQVFGTFGIVQRF